MVSIISDQRKNDFVHYVAFTDVASWGRKEKEKEKKEVSTHDQESAALSNLQKLWPRIQETNNIGMFFWFQFLWL